MMNPFPHGFIGLLSLALASSLHAADGLELKLVSDVDTISPGKSFTVGLNLRHKEGFHTYWKNPGIVGIPTALNWNLPDGFSAGDIQWPHPEKTFMSGHPCHGYERDITLLITITPPEILPEEKIILRASAQWMACAAQCFPGFGDFQISFPRESTTDRILIEKAQSEIPKKDPQLKVSLKSQKDAPIIELLIKGNHSEKNLYFFSEDGQISSDQLQNITRLDEKTLVLKVKRSDFSPQNVPGLPGVLHLGKRNHLIKPVYSD
ncbi:MAG: protein-disulfide reductase DsbD family protein [Akkermansiaceae bacterium]